MLIQHVEELVAIKKHNTIKKLMHTHKFYEAGVLIFK